MYNVGIVKIKTKENTMFYKTHEIEQMHEGKYIAFENNTWTVYSDGNIIAVYIATMTANKVINGAQRIK
jgi:hypothetical protein